MTFAVTADAYDRFMGRYSMPLAPLFAELAGVERGQRALDVGCGPGALTAELVERLGAEAVAAVDPSESFVAAAQERHPGVDVRRAAAEGLPFADDEFDVTLAQLVVHFMSDPVAGLREMARVTRPDGVVAACVWDLAGGRSPLTLFWKAARQVNPGCEDESRRPGAGQGQLVELFEAAGLHAAEERELAVRLEHAGFDEWWEPFTQGVGPAGGYLARLDPEKREQIGALARELAPEAPFVLDTIVWAARARA